MQILQKASGLLLIAIGNIFIIVNTYFSVSKIVRQTCQIFITTDLAVVRPGFSYTDLFKKQVFGTERQIEKFKINKKSQY